VVLDYLREGVLIPDLYDPTLDRFTAMFSPTTARWPCRVVSRSSAAADWVGMARKADQLKSRGRRRGVGEIASERSDW
jgi:hypothetical protein